MKGGTMKIILLLFLFWVGCGQQKIEYPKDSENRGLRSTPSNIVRIYIDISNKIVLEDIPVDLQNLEEIFQNLRKVSGSGTLIITHIDKRLKVKDLNKVCLIAHNSGLNRIAIVSKEDSGFQNFRLASIANRTEAEILKGEEGAKFITDDLISIQDLVDILSNSNDESYYYLVH